MKLGVIGGSGLYNIEGLTDLETKSLDTPFGPPSDDYVRGKLDGCEIFFLPRHGRGHRILPSEINYRANIYGFKLLGVEQIMSISAVGSLKEELRPGDMVLPDQYYDRTRSAFGHTFFGEGIVAHVAFGDPTCATFRELLADVSRRFIAEEWHNKDVRVVSGGTYVNMQGPAFSTRAESNAYRQFGFDIIGMTSLAEAKLCREAEICYQAMAMVTDYDCWKIGEEAVNIDLVIQTLSGNTQLAKTLLPRIVAGLPDRRSCRCGESLSCAIVTDPSVIPDETRMKLKPIIGKYIP
ncbi:MAG: S-methyl-5'-thioadenosine phosphorylase [Lentisphaerales bacterium]|jgi:5'-methylthioadenosine phosphorylase|nr:MAG: S-methyl-5'-thioadenosine phosphorylase [Lentisphaerales bacterium]